MKTTSLVLVLLAALGLSCTSAGPADTNVIHPPAAAADALRFFGPSFDVPASSEMFFCYTIPLGNTDPLYVTGTHAFQSPGGHHTLVLSVDLNESTTDTPHECTGADMAYESLRFIGAGTAAGDGINLPLGLAMMVPPGRKLLVQAHYINTTSATLRVQDAIDLTHTDRASVEHIAGAYTQVDGALDLPPHLTTSRSVSCSPPVAMTVPWMFTHMHEWGTHGTIELTQGGVTRTLYDADWDPAFRDHFPLVNFDPPLQLAPGDRLVTHCTWNNTENEEIIFPREMCATFMPFYPSDGTFWVCDETGMNSQL